MKLRDAQILHTPMQPNDSGADTIRGYLIALLSAVWAAGDGFSGKHPFGNSDWEWDLLEALLRAGHIDRKYDANGYLVDEKKGRALIASAIKALGDASEVTW